MRHTLAAVVRILLKLVWALSMLALVAMLALVLGIRILSHELSNRDGQAAAKHWLAQKGITMVHDTFAFTPRLNEFTLDIENLTIAYPGGTVDIARLYANLWLLTDFFDNDAASRIDIQGVVLQPETVRFGLPSTITNTTATAANNATNNAAIDDSQDTLAKALTTHLTRLGLIRALYPPVRSLMGSTLAITITNARYQQGADILSLNAAWQDTAERDRMELSTAWQMPTSEGAWRTDAVTKATHHMTDSVWHATSTAAFRLDDANYATTITHTFARTLNSLDPLTDTISAPVLTSHIEARTPLGDMTATNTIAFTDGLTKGITSTFERIDMVRNGQHTINNLRARLTENNLRVTLPALPLKLLDPVLNNLQLRGNLANIVWQNGKLYAVGTNITVGLPHLYANPIPIAYATLAHDAHDASRLIVHAHNGDERITMTYADRQLYFEGANLNHARTLSLIPDRRLKPRVYAWITAHLKNTRITTGSVAIDLTTKGHTPTLTLTFDNADILPAPNYPWIHTQNAQVLMDSAGLSVMAPSAKTMVEYKHQSSTDDTTQTATVALGHLNVHLDRFRTLTANADIVATLNDTKRYVQHTPLMRRKALAAFFKEATLKGDAVGRLNIATALTNPEPTFALQLATRNGALAYPPLPDITDIQAAFHITEQGIETQSTGQARMHGEDATFTIRTDTERTRIRAHAPLNIAHWIPAIADRTTGTARAVATITLPRRTTPPTVAVTSSLEGIQSTLPAPLAKTATSTMHLDLTAQLGRNMRLDGTLADMALTYERLNKSDESNRRTLTLTNEVQDITLTLEDNTYKNAPHAATQHETTLAAHSEQWLWNIAKPEPKLPPKPAPTQHNNERTEAPTTADGKNDNSNKATTQQPTATRFPKTPLHATWHLDAFRLNDIAMGQTTLTARATTNQITLSGRITADEDAPQTIRFNAQHSADERGTLTFTVQADTIPPWLGLIGLPLGAVKAEDVDIQGALHWANSLPSLKADDLMGTIRFTSEAGELTELEPGVLRVVSLLNIRAILRRLQLNVADVAAKGTAFDEMKGRITLTPEHYRVDSIRMDSVALILELSGTIHRTDKTLDLTATARPILTPSGVSLAAIFGSITALATPLTAGLYALALGGVSEGLDLEIGDAHYHIGGTITKPIITEARAP